MKFYEELNDMEFAVGDTLPVFNITVEIEDGTSLEDSRMILTISSTASPDDAIIEKECITTSEGFKVRLTSEDTIKLVEGTYYLFFHFIDPEENIYKKLACSLYVRSSPKVV